MTNFGEQNGTAMKIGFDGKRAVCNNTGLGNYSRLVIEQLAASARKGEELFVYTPRMTDNPRLTRIKTFPQVRFMVRHPRFMESAAAWRSRGIVRDMRHDAIDLYHGLSNELPLNIAASGIPSVLTMHDVIYRRLPYCYSAIDRLLYDYKYGRSCRAATRIIAISECTKRDIIHYYNVPEEKIDVVYQGCDPQFSRQWSHEESDTLRRRLDLPERYVVQVGTVERRKNLELTVRAMAALPPEIKLVAIGRDNSYMKRVQAIARKEGVADRVIFMGAVPFADLPGVYQAAEAIAYPSRYEGFGLPVIEGILSRRPVIAATGSCLEEAGGEGAIYVNPDDVRGMAEALRSVTDGSADTAAMTMRGLRHVARFDTAVMADNIHTIYAKTLSYFQNQNQ